MICVPLREKTLTSLLKNLSEAQKVGADLVEIWFDEINLDQTALRKIFRQKKIPFIYKVTNARNLEILSLFPIDFFDLDWQIEKSSLKNIKTQNSHSKIIISYHNFERTPSDAELKKIIMTIKKKGGNIVKIATQAQTFGDSLRMLQFISQNAPKTPLIALCMGKEGRITRATGHLFGNYLMYAPLTAAKNTASGQMTFSKLKELQCLLK